jgi:hypothetical protein
MEPACKRKKLRSFAVPLQAGFSVAVIQGTYYFSVEDRMHVLLSKTMVPAYQTTLCLNSEDHSMNLYSTLKLKF